MTPLRIAIVDDEALVRRGVRELLRSESDVRVVGEACNGREAVALIRAEQPDLVFLDIQMPGLDGFDVLRQIEPARPPAVIFITAHDAYAIRAFDHHAVDYLLKPFDGERFRLAFARARRRLGEVESCNADGPPGRAASEASAKERFIERVLIRHDGRASVMSVNDIIWLQAADNYVRVHTERARYLIRAQLGAMEQRLDPRQFIRVHRSTIVNVSRIAELTPLFGGDYKIRLSTGATLRVSRGFRERLRRVIGQLT